MSSISPFPASLPSAAPMAATIPWDRVLAPRAGRPRALPLLLVRVPAGFPSPADDYVDKSLDLNEHLVPHPESTFFLRVQGESMIGAGIHDNDILVVDRSLRPTSGKVVVAVVDGELTVKRLLLANDRWVLMPENPDYPPLEVPPESDFQVWGVVRHVVHSV